MSNIYVLGAVCLEEGQWNKAYVLYSLTFLCGNTWLRKAYWNICHSQPWRLISTSISNLTSIATHTRKLVLPLPVTPVSGLGEGLAPFSTNHRAPAETWGIWTHQPVTLCSLKHTPLPSGHDDQVNWLWLFVETNVNIWLDQSCTEEFWGMWMYIYTTTKQWLWETNVQCVKTENNKCARFSYYSSRVWGLQVFIFLFVCF